MAKRAARRLVIDADVLRASGGRDAVPPSAKRCREFLEAVLSICHYVVLTPDIGKQWKQHMSRFARTWRCSMEARKKVFREHPDADESLRQCIEQHGTSQKQRTAMLKDVLLIEAATATDSLIASNDEAARKAYSQMASQTRKLRRIVWVNPSLEEDDSLTWLKNGARAERERTLGSA